LSTLSYKPVAEKIIALVKHERWEVRSVAVNSLAALGPSDYTDQFVLALQDSEWQVRFNAGSALSKIRDGTIREKVLATGDKFALDMLEYMTDMVEIGGAVK
jgi:HEAT repeat protein